MSGAPSGPTAATPRAPLLATDRPDPDALIARLRADAARAGRGRLKIFFGASAGVGKTYAMLAAARRLHEAGSDVLIGVIETHGRGETEAMAAGLPRLALRAVARGSHTLEEFDLDAALARKPALILVDELAHSNVPGSRHPKRWQDVEELLAAGIDVYSTVNVQHLETLNDVVSGITGIRVWETIPDRVFDGADEVVLVDLTPDELLMRLRQGKVYLAQQAERAVRNFFRKGNLIALRELALRRTADRVDVEMLQYRRDRSVAPVWQTRDSVLAAVSGGADAERVVRSAARIANRLDVPWHAAFVDVPDERRSAQQRRAAALQLLTLAQSLGADTAILPGSEPAGALVQFARDHNLTRIVLGRTRPRAWAPWRRALGERIAALAADVEVTTIAGTGRTRRTSAEAARVSNALAGVAWRSYAASAALCALTALLATALLPVFAPADVVMLFLLAVVLVGVRLGRGPAVLAALLSVAEFDFFFVPPRFSFAVADTKYLVTFAVMFAAALLAGQITAGLNLQARVATARERRVRALYEMARELSGALLTEQIAQIGEGFVDGQFDARSCLVLADDSGRVVAPVGTALAVDTGIAQWALDHAQAAGLGTNTLPAHAVRYVPLKAPMRVRGLLALEPRDPSRLLGPDAQRLLDTVAHLIAIALERVHYVQVAQQSTLQMESERLRNSLLAAISHDLRTPLAVLVGLADSLRLTQPPPAPAQTALIDQVRDQAQRLRALVENLLDMARLQAGRVSLQRQWHPVEELVETALRAMATALQPRAVQVQLAPDLPLVDVDAALFERVLCNLLENAAKFTGPDSHIEIGASAQAGELTLWIDDDGPGLPPGREEEIFKKFERGDKESTTPGVGLGLAICRAIVEAHGGRIRAHNRVGGGARFLIELPCHPPPAPEAAASAAAAAADAATGARR